MAHQHAQDRRHLPADGAPGERAFRHTRTVEIVCTLTRSLRTLREHSTIPIASQATDARRTILRRIDATSAG